MFVPVHLKELSGLAQFIYPTYTRKDEEKNNVINEIFLFTSFYYQFIPF